MNFSRSASAAMPGDNRRMAATAEEGTARKLGSRKCGERTKPIAETSAVRGHAGKTAIKAPQAHQQDTNRIIGSNVRLGTEMPVGLLDDVARCNGIDDGAEVQRMGCDRCLRRTAKRGERVVMMQPPTVIVFECEYLIEP